ncbi:MAG: AAA family ATPase [Acidocella sp. 35-58-6]|nr:MAG: AAA family ATPase [Acidocella sp. 35-58-6]
MHIVPTTSVPHKAWWSATLEDFRSRQNESIVERLALRLVESHPLNHATQLLAWRKQLEILRDSTENLPDHWRILFEYPLLRLGRRLDVTIISDHAIVVIEFKVGAKTFDVAALRQAEDYALDLQDFHAASRNKLIIPVLVASDATAQSPSWVLLWHGVVPPFTACASSLSDLLVGIFDRIPSNQINIEGWEQSPYRPVPTIVEAATTLYAKHGVSEIAAARADVTNLTRTTQAILDTIKEARDTNAHIIIFVTGIPGAGKTLCGLNAVFGADTGAAFLTGNLPLVHVLREALARDAARDPKTSIRQARQKTESAVQGLTGFVRDNVERATPPHEHVVVFDEAQRAWDAAYAARKFNLHDSEAALFLDIMHKHQDYAVIVALVGNGQEINTGEAGLGEWGRALIQRPDWQVRAAPSVLTTLEPRQRLFVKAPANISVIDALHLDIPIRAIRSAAGAPWVDAVLRGATNEARQHAQNDVPFFITRSLTAMRHALRVRARGERRAGLVCSTGARRLVADGIWPDFPHLDNDAIANWFLNRWPDVRASDALEIPATQFACQGLELDYVGLCWGGDLVWQNDWLVRKFVGTKWQTPTKQDAIDFRINTYRVLLTRARYDTIIWVPEGVSEDPTREPALLNETVAYLVKCGARLLDECTVPPAIAPLQRSLI